MNIKVIKIFIFTLCCISSSHSQKICELGKDLPPAERQIVVNKRSYESVFEIPVVFHVVGNDDLINRISSNDLENLLQYCNQIFSAKNESLINVRDEFESIIGIANIKLKLEQIVYRETDTKFFKDVWGSANNLEDAKVTSKGGSDPFDTNEFLNIWICNVLRPNGSVNNFNSSYATPPVDAPGWPEFDLIQGVLIDDLVVLDRINILPHELGHYFGLRHVVEITQNNCLDNDGIEDTPPCLRSPECIFGDSCPGGKTDMIENFMNPQVLNCRMAFTKGQTSYMRNIIEEYRSLLFYEIIQDSEENHQELTIFPNPINREFTIEFEECDVKFVQAYIYSSNGTLMFDDRFVATNSKIIDINDFAAGVYYIKIEFKERKEVFKIVKI